MRAPATHPSLTFMYSRYDDLFSGLIIWLRLHLGIGTLESIVPRLIGQKQPVHVKFVVIGCELPGAWRNRTALVHGEVSR
jgi:hypothetical protein